MESHSAPDRESPGRAARSRFWRRFRLWPGRPAWGWGPCSNRIELRFNRSRRTEIMSEMANQESALKLLLDRMVEARQLSSVDAETLARQLRPGQETPLKTEEDVLRWVAKEYD